MELLSEFINTERERFSVRHNNLFAFSFSQISRYYEFLKIIQERYHKVSASFIENTKAQQATFQSGTHTMTDEQMAILNKGRGITTILHLEIESYFLFAKILLDKVARAIEFYFGQARNLSLDSYDDLTKKFGNYISTKQLTVLSSDLNELMKSLKECVSDYRDKEITHEKSSRTMKATMFSYGANSTVWVASTKIYPTEKDKQVESKEIDEVMNLIDKYISEIVKYIQKNKEKTNLEIANITS
ncbi:MAG: hypothetical protein AAB567_02395 [Patescibacteria group bacterium]